MPSVAARLESPPASGSWLDQHEDHIILLEGVSWSQYSQLLRGRGERSVPKMVWMEGVLELMSPSISHEVIARLIGRLLERWCEEHGIAVNACGSWTVRRKPAKRGAEADGCYVIGRDLKDLPDLAIEVVWTHGGLDKLEVWRGLGVSEVWIWQDGDLLVWALEGDRYVSSERSRLLPELDVALLGQYATETDQTAAVRAFLLASRARE